MNSPLGQYAPIVAALTCGGIIVAFVVALMLKNIIGIDDASVSALHDLAILAFGAVVGSAVAVNGWKQPVTALHERVDALEASTGVPTHPTAPPETTPAAG